MAEINPNTKSWKRTNPNLGTERVDKSKNDLETGEGLVKNMLLLAGVTIFVIMISYLYSMHNLQTILVSNETQSSDISASYQYIDALIKGERVFFQKILETIFVNVLLPVLTALVGYTFGKSRLRN